MKSLKLFILGILCANLTYSQNEVDALRYSNLNYFGTARFMGSGGSMSAYGKDFSAINQNPASQAGYKWSEIGLTGNITGNTINNSYNNSNGSDLRSNFNISNFGVVFTIKQNPERITNWREIQFGYSKTRTNDFVGKSIVRGNHDNSMLHSFANRGNTGSISGGFIDPNDLSAYYEGLIYDAYLTNFDTVSKTYSPYTSSTNIDQERITKTRGHQYSNDITISANYSNKLYIGGSIGFPSIKYEKTSVYKETFRDDLLYDLEEFTLEENLVTKGSGYNAKIGIIYMPVRNIRIGLALHTGSFYNMNDTYSTKVTSDFTDNDYDSEISSEEGTYDYEIRTPARYMASVAYLINKRGFISFEYEYVDYKNAKLSADDYNFEEENKKVKEIYQGANILKIGAEFRVSNNWTIRAGAAHYGSPIKSDATTVDNTRRNFSGGFGYQKKKYSIDFAYVRSMSNESTYLYDPAYTKPVSIDNSMNNFMMTAAYRF